MNTSHRPVVSRLVAATLCVFAAHLLAACGSSSDLTNAPTTTPTAASRRCVPDVNAAALPDAKAVHGSIRVLAAASLTGAFSEIATEFSNTYPDAKVATSFGASSDLVAQIHQGAPADVLATADTDTMDQAVHPSDGRSGDVDAPVTMTCNRLVILTAKGNPLHIRGLADLARDDVRFVLCAAPVPCGRLGREVLAKAGVDAEPMGSEANVKAVVAKVAAGEADAGIVYVTDAQAARDTTGSVTIPADQNLTTAYPIAITRATSRSQTAKAFVAFVLSAKGQKILRDNGFGSS